MKTSLDNTDHLSGVAQTEAVEWLQFVLNTERTIPSINNWRNVFVFCDKQKIGGVCEPTRFDVHVDDKVLLGWVALVRQLEISNSLLNERVCQLFQKLQKDGFRCCLLKGQGNAEMYPNPNLRFPGDIDVWIDADERSIYEYVIKLFPNAKESFKHIKFPVFTDVHVDVHQTPLKLRNTISHSRLQQWIEDNKEEQFSHMVKLTGTETEVAVPTVRFNAVYHLGHIMTHIFDKGIGLRQLIDYYYVLKNLEGISEEEKEQIRKAWKRFGMGRLASAIMWIEHEVLGLPEQYLLTTPDEKWGRKIFEGTLEGGNFGKYSQRQVNVGKSRLNKRIATFKRLMSLFLCFPGETFSRLMTKTVTMFKRDMGKMINLSVR